MASLINKYFHRSRTTEQNIINGFITESIQILGSTYYYLPRDVQIKDLILGEDILSRFQLAIPIEMYLSDTVGFQGDREMFSKFGLEIRNSYKLVVGKDRWDEEVKSLFDNVSYNAEASFDIANYIRPREGDLIYDPITRFLMEIKFADHDVEFFALGKNYQYYLTCEAFQYQSETIFTGISEIDLFAENSRSTSDFQVLAENGNTLLFENGNYISLDREGSPLRGPESEVAFDSLKTNIKYTVVDPFGR